MTVFNKKAITLVETLASIIIITFVFTAVLTILVNVRKQTSAINERVVAVNVAKMIRDDIEGTYQYTDLDVFIISNDLIIDNDNCATIPLANVCDLFTYSVDGNDYFDNVTVIFYASTPESIDYGIIHFGIEIIYFDERDITIEGLIYE